mgnify:CR=1 FL=1|tara:strand:- start:98 stop:523 length:426 start_codon:yes stop_codon:yes gene_type:complete
MDETPFGVSVSNFNSSTMTIKSLYFLVQESEGFSVRGEDLLTYASADGYAVGGAVKGAVFKCKNDALSFRIFNREMNRLQSAVSDHNQVIGAWVDVVEDPAGVAYLELSDVVKSKHVALELAKARGEKAIYDFANSETIYL